MAEWKTEFKEIEIGKGRKIKDGKDIAILSLGHPGNFVAAAIRNLKNMEIEPAHYDIRFVKPLDEEMLHEIFQKFKKVITVEDGTILGGFGSAVLEFMAANNYQAEVRLLGIPDKLIEHGTIKQLHRDCGFDTEGIEQTVKEMMSHKVNVSLLQ